MSELRKLQELLQAYLTKEDISIEKLVNEPANGKSAERLAIYSNAYELRLAEALTKEYATLKRYLDAEKFMELSKRYLDAYPSVYFSIDDFGQNLPNFLAQTAPYCEKPHLSELAQFIWELRSALTAADSTLLTKEEIQKVPQKNWPTLCFKLHPSLHIIKLEWNVLSIWQALEKRQKPPKPQAITTHCIVWRKQLQPHYLTVKSDAAWMLQALKEGKNFAEICEGLLEWHNEENVAQQAISYLFHWLNNEMLSELCDNSDSQK